MTYVDTSVVLAHLLAEDRVPPPDVWTATPIASRLAVYETWTRVHARRLTATHGDAVRTLFGSLALIEMVAPVLTRAREPFPTPVRTLDALHLASIEFLRSQGQTVSLATYDERLRKGAAALGIPLYPLP
jgi:predicted nucleic acid-binding protein